jgi:hypothetical protein
MAMIMQMYLQTACQQLGKGSSLESSFNNAGLDEWERGAEKGETIWWASIFGGTSID